MLQDIEGYIMAVKKLKNFSCPFCGGTEFVKGRTVTAGMAGFQGSSSSVLIAPLQYKGKLLDFHKITQPEICVYCKNCGSLVRQYITNPELLENKK